MVESIFVVGAVVGATELIKRLKEKDYWAALTIAVSAAIGALAGVFGIDGLTVAYGIVAGLAASGLVTVATKVGKVQ